MKEKCPNHPHPHLLQAQRPLPYYDPIKQDDPKLEVYQAPSHHPSFHWSTALSTIQTSVRRLLNFSPGDGPHKPLAFDQILVHLFLLFVFNLTNKILFKPNFSESLLLLI